MRGASDPPAVGLARGSAASAARGAAPVSSGKAGMGRPIAGWLMT